MPYAKIQDCKLHYVEADPDNSLSATEERQGRKRACPTRDDTDDNRTPIIFLHGFTLDHRQWTRQVGFFSGEAGTDGHPYRAIALDSRGHGKSEAPATGYSRADRVEDLRQFVDRLKIVRFHLVGLSMGGTTGIGFALAHSNRLKSLTLVSSAAAGYSIGKKIINIDLVAKKHGIEAAKKRWKKMTLSFYNEDQADIARLMTEMVNDHSGTIWADEMRGKYAREEDLPRLHLIDLPTLIMCGQVDKVFHEVGEKIHKRIKNSRFISYPGVGHMINLEIPEQFNADLKAFLQVVE